jgi:RHS repeat-associated protein
MSASHNGAVVSETCRRPVRHRDGNVRAASQNWAGVYEDGTVVTGGSLGYTWPGRQQNFYMASDARFATIYANGWYGDVLDGNGGADPAGTVYFRNRYYDPVAGQFTQQDPIGLAGGLNVYGFAGGDRKSVAPLALS